MKSSRRTISLLTVFVVGSALALVFINSHFDQDKMFLILPSHVVGQVFTTYERMTNSVPTYVESIDVQVIQMNMTDPNPSDVRRFSDNYSNSRAFLSFSESVTDTFARDGFDFKNFYLQYPLPQNIPDAMKNKVDSFTPVWLTATSFSEEKKEGTTANFFVFKSNGKFMTFGWQYITEKFKPSGSIVRDPTYAQAFDIYLGPNTRMNNICFYAETIFYIGNNPVDVFLCEDFTEVRWDLNNKEESYLGGNTLENRRFSVVDECSPGSLWQQFACRYLGQSKYDEKGNLKPEVRAELGLSE